MSDSEIGGELAIREFPLKNAKLVLGIIEKN